MNQKAIRWQQRFENYNKAFQKLENALKITKMSELERAGLIQYFEFTFELGWKTLKDYLEAEGYDVKSPREPIKQAFQNNLITQGQTWLEALEDRNLMTHTYDEEKSLQAEQKIRHDYFTLLKQLHETLSKSRT